MRLFAEIRSGSVLKRADARARRMYGHCDSYTCEITHTQVPKPVKQNSRERIVLQARAKYSSARAEKRDSEPDAASRPTEVHQFKQYYDCGCASAVWARKATSRLSDMARTLCLSTRVSRARGASALWSRNSPHRGFLTSVLAGAAA